MYQQSRQIIRFLLTCTSRVPLPLPMKTCKAMLLNHYFFSVFTYSAYQLPSTHKVAHAVPTLNCINIDEQQNSILSLDTSKATGIDTINPSVLKHCAMPLAQPLCHLLRYCLSTCNIPSKWRINCITLQYLNQGTNQTWLTIDLFLFYARFQKYWRDCIYNHLINFLADRLFLQPAIWISSRLFLTTTIIT